VHLAAVLAKRGLRADAGDELRPVGTRDLVVVDELAVEARDHPVVGIRTVNEATPLPALRNEATMPLPLFT
jgi:hypothetical protein